MSKDWPVSVTAKWAWGVDTSIGKDNSSETPEVAGILPQRPPVWQHDAACRSCVLSPLRQRHRRRPALHRCLPPLPPLSQRCLMLCMPRARLIQRCPLPCGAHACSLAHVIANGELSPGRWFKSGGMWGLAEAKLASTSLNQRQWERASRSVHRESGQVHGPRGASPDGVSPSRRMKRGESFQTDDLFVDSFDDAVPDTIDESEGHSPCCRTLGSSWGLLLVEYGRFPCVLCTV